MPYKPCQNSVRSGRITKTQLAWVSASKSTPALESFFGASSNTAQSKTPKSKPKVHRVTWKHAAALSSRIDAFVLRSAATTTSDAPLHSPVISNNTSLGQSSPDVVHESHSQPVLMPRRSFGEAVAETNGVQENPLSDMSEPDHMSSKNPSTVTDSHSTAIQEVHTSHTVLPSPNVDSLEEQSSFRGSATQDSLQWFLSLDAVINARGDLVAWVQETLHISEAQNAITKGTTVSQSASNLADHLANIVTLSNFHDDGAVDGQTLMPLNAQISVLEASLSGSEWMHGYDKTLDALWLELVTKIAISEPAFNVSHLVKPSGVTSSVLHLRWHYPSFTTAYPFFGCTADFTNPCLRHAMEKLGLCTGHEIFMSEMIYGRYNKRHNGDQNPYDSEDETIIRYQLDFAECILSVGRIVLLLGAVNFLQFKKSPYYARARGLVLWPTRRIFGQEEDAFIVYHPDGSIQQLVILAWHCEGLLRTGSETFAAQQDAAWNLAAVLSGLQTGVKYSHFQDFVVKRHLPKSQEHAVSSLDFPMECPNDEPLSRIVQLLMFERFSGKTVEFKDLGTCLYDWLSTVPFRYDNSSTVSLVAQIHCELFANSGVRQQRALGFPNLVKARQVMQVNAKLNGYPNLQKAWAATKAAGFPSLEKARATLKALGPGTRIVRAYVDAGCELLRKYSTVSSQGQPQEINRECSVCHETVIKDCSPRWFDLRKAPPGRNAGVYTMRRVYWPLYVPTGSPAAQYLCSCRTSRNKSVEYIPINGKRCNPGAETKIPWTTLKSIPAPKGELLYAFRKEMLKGFANGKVEFGGQVVRWNGARAEVKNQSAALA
ncbi:hypothetical protein BKA64DRAFT_723414 [Cadophora sp. MPI-SDFR-AT-0126]|nr:hypothetical protein BKA64DRAFT_723414 [Leotiomycetes sp. MPI-SDFR-AT-0126]